MYEDIWSDLNSLINESQSKDEKKKICDCEEHNEYNVLEDISNGQVLCTKCGFVMQMSWIDQTSESSGTYSADGEYMSNNSQIGMKVNPLFPKSNLSTIISGTSKMAQVNKWNAMPYDEKVLYDILLSLKLKFSEQILESIITQSVFLFKQINNKKNEHGKREIHRGKIRNGLIACCVYHACKSCNVERIPEEICNILGVSSTVFCKCNNLFQKLNINVNSSISTPTNFLSRFCRKLNLDFKVEKLIGKIIKCTEENKILSGSTPQSIIGGITYFVVTELKLNECELASISEVCKISKVTILKKCSILSKHKALIYDSLKNETR